MNQLIYIIELLAIFQCIHCVYGRKVKINILNVSIFGVMMVVINLANANFGVIGYSILMYAVLAFYCVCAFRSNFKETIINMVLYIILISSIQFICCIPSLYFIKDNLKLSMLIADMLFLIMSIYVLPRLEIHKLAKWALKKNIIFYISIGYIFLFISIMLLQIKALGSIDMENVFFLIPLVIFSILICRQWSKYQVFYEQKEKELEIYVKDKQSFNSLIKKIRLKNHEVNNHIMSIIAMHYTINTYDELVKAQKDYCNYINLGKEYNALLLLSNSVISGFLHEKFICIESKGIKVMCTVSVQNYDPVIPEYIMVEILGILLDNAMEAVEDIADKIIDVAIVQNDKGYEYIVRNRFRFVHNEEIIRWFDYEESTKGEGRGLGLYHLKELCKEWNCTIKCSNEKIHEKNWIEFRIGTGRKG